MIFFELAKFFWEKVGREEICSQLRVKAVLFTKEASKNNGLKIKSRLKTFFVIILYLCGVVKTNIMTELIFRNGIEREKLNSIVTFLNSWGVVTEVRTTAVSKRTDVGSLFAESFGMWADRDIDIRKIRQQARQRRTKSYDNGAL